LRNGHAKFGRPQLKHVRSALVDLDTDVGVHDTRIADPRTGQPAGAGAGPPRVVRFPSAVVTIADCNSLIARGEVLVSLNFATWNQLDGWLRRLEELRRAA
jgi:hypothetical protein